jgi:hypothetical protein
LGKKIQKAPLFEGNSEKFRPLYDDQPMKQFDGFAKTVVAQPCRNPDSYRHHGHESVFGETDPSGKGANVLPEPGGDSGGRRNVRCRHHQTFWGRFAKRKTVFDSKSSRQANQPQIQIKSGFPRSFHASAIRLGG